MDNETAQVHTSFGEYKFRLDLQPIFVSGTEEEDIEALVSRQKLLAVYLFDETEILRYRQEITFQTNPTDQACTWPRTECHLHFPRQYIVNVLLMHLPYYL